MLTLMCSSVSIVGIILVLSQTLEIMSKRPTWQRAKHFCEEPQRTLIWENSIQPQEFDHAPTASKPGCPACCSTRLLSVAILSNQSIQHVAYRKLPQRSPTGGITTQHLCGPAAWLCPHTWQIAWCQSSPWNSQAVSRFTGKLLYIDQIITITPSRNLLILDTDLSENRLPHSIHWLIIRFHIV